MSQTNNKKPTDKIRAKLLHTVQNTEFKESKHMMTSSILKAEELEIRGQLMSKLGRGLLEQEEKQQEHNPKKREKLKLLKQMLPKKEKLQPKSLRK